MKKLTNRVKLSSALILILGFTGTAFSIAPHDDLTEESLAESVGYTSATPVKRIQNYRIGGFNTIDNKSLILNSGASDRYLVTLHRSCYGLRWANTIGTTSTVSQLTTFDNVLVPRSHRGREVCPIDAIYKLEGKLEEAS